MTTALFALEGFAAPSKYGMSFEIAVDGKVVSTARLISLAHQKATITQKSEDMSEQTTIEVEASEASGQGLGTGILLDMTIQYLKQRVVEINAKPRVIAREGSPATVVWREKDLVGGTKEVRLGVVAHALP